MRGFIARMLRLLPLMTALALVVPAASASAAVGDKDPTFGISGELRFDGDIIRAVARQDDGKLVLVGEHKEAIGRVHRLNPDGVPDTSFGDKGTISIDGPGTDRLRAVVIQPGGKITVGGSADGRARLYRFDAQGKPDPGFGANGIAALTTETVTEHVHSLTIAPDGKLVAAGETFDGLGDAIVWRRDGATGAPDATFNAGGRFHFGFGVDSTERALGVAVQPDNRIVVAGNTTVGTDAFVARLDPVLGFDTAFRDGGKARLDVGGGEFANTVTLQPDGNIIVAGRTTVGFNGIVWRMLPTGAPDPLFNDSGVKFVDSAADESIRAVLRQPDGKLVLVGGTTAGVGGGDAAFYRLTADGKFDNSFQEDGAIGYDSGAQETMFGAVLEPDGNIVGAGASGGNGVVYRLLGEPQPLTVNVSSFGRVVSVPTGIDCPGTCTARFDVGTTVRLHAVPAGGSALAGWTGAPCSGLECQVKVDRPLVVNATFYRLPVTPPRDTTPPRITRAWIVGRTINVRVSEQARVTATVKRGSKVVTRVTGTTRKLKLRKRLARGRYRVEVVAVDAARNRSRAVVLRMRVV